VTRQNLGVSASQQTRNISKKAKEAERNIVVKLLKDVPRFGRAGTMHLLQKFDMCPLQVP